ncbi:MAG: glycosyltransferase [Bacteroidales bacterium]|jgi:glycosyltransferase involved in cell wall biosynthesis
MGNKKLLIVGGGIVHAYNMIELIKGYFDDIFLITDVKDDKFKDINHEVLDFSFSNPLNIIIATQKIKTIIKKINPDFIITMQIDTGAFCTHLANNGKIPSMVVGFGSDVLIIPYKGFLYKFMAKFILNRGKYFNAGSNYVAQGMNKLAEKDLSVMVSNFGIDDNIISSEKQNIVYSNRLHSSLYRIPLIIEAFARFIEKEERKDWELVIAATGNKEELKAKVKELGIDKNVSFVGWLDKEQNYYYYSISKIWISIPKSDSIPISLLEAMAAGSIPIISDLPSIKDFFINGENGIIVKNFDENYIEKALELNFDDVSTRNVIKAKYFGSKEKNRALFYSIFDKEFKK